MKPSYNPQEWAAATKRGRHIFNYNFHMTANKIRGWELVKTAKTQLLPNLTEKFYIWEKKGSGGHELVKITITELCDWRKAQHHMHEQLCHSMCPNIPKGSGKLSKTGDINFIGREPKSKLIAGVFFTRGNLSVTVNSVGDKVVDVSKITAMLDKTFSAPPKKEEIKKGFAQVIAPASLKVQKNKPAIVIEKLPEPVPSSGWFKIIAPDGELSRQDDTVIYTTLKNGEKLIGKYIGDCRLK